MDTPTVTSSRSETGAADPPRPDAVAGLADREVTARRERFGANSTPAPPPRSTLRRVLTQLSDPLVMLLLAAMALTVLLADLTDAVVILLVIVVNTTVGLVQEKKADRALDALRQLAAPSARVRRGGHDRIVPAADLVPGDLVLLDAGDIIPADLTVMEAVRLQVDEATLTGESVPVSKALDDEGFAGTVVVTGRGSGLVTRTGIDSALGRIAAMVAAEPIRRTPLQKRLTSLSWVLGGVALGLSTVVLVAGLLQGRGLAEMVVTAISLTVAAVPESLPAVVTVALAMGAYRMARRSAIVRNLPAVETLGSVTVVAADKTGTLTEGRMAVEQLVTPTGTANVSGEGYEPAGSTDGGGPELERLTRDIALCNDAALTEPADGQADWSASGDPMEAALLAAAYRCGTPRTIRHGYPRLDEVPFDGARHRMTTVHAAPDGTVLVVCKGAPEALFGAAGLLGEAPERVAEFAQQAQRLAEAGYRVLAVADGERADAENPEIGLRFAGLVALVDPVRAEAAGAVRSFADAGIRLVLITGDHAATTTAVADRLAVPPGRVVLGAELDEHPEDIEDVRIFARTRPEQKLGIVGALQDAGNVVAMTGDGVNDAPALRRADIGVAMGKDGTEAARQAGDLILADDNLATVGAAVEEGRRIYANVRRFLGYALAGGFAEVLVMMAGPFLGFGVPLLPAQILWINMLTHGLPGVALGAEPAEPDGMRQPPRPPSEAMLGAGLWRRVVGTGLLITVVSLVAAQWALVHGRPWQSALFVTLSFAQLGVALAVQARHVQGVRRNRLLLAAVALSALLQVAAVQVGPLAALLRTDPLSAADFLVCLGLAVVPGAVLGLIRLRTRRPVPASPAGPDHRPPR